MKPEVIPSGEMNWKQSARNPGEHRVWRDEVSGYRVHCAACGYRWNECHRIDCNSCGADGIAEAARVFFAGTVKGKSKMKSGFADAVSRLGTDRPKQYVFSVEVILREDDLRDEVLDDAAEMIRTIGSFEIADVEELSPVDERWI